MSNSDHEEILNARKRIIVLTEQNERLKKKLHSKIIYEEISLGRSMINAKKYADAIIEDLC